MITLLATLLLMLVGCGELLGRFRWGQRLLPLGIPMAMAGGLLGLAQSATLAGGGRGAAPVLALLGGLLVLTGVALSKLSARPTGLRVTSLLGAVLLCGAAIAPQGGPFPAASSDVGHVGWIHGVFGGLAYALLWAGLIRVWLQSPGFARDFRYQGCVAIALMLLALLALPGWNGTVLGNELGVLAQQEGRLVYALAEVGDRSTPRGAELVSASVRVPVALRVPFSGAGGVLIFAAGLLFLAFFGFVSSRPQRARGGPELFAPHLLAVASALLITVVLALAATPWVAAPWTLSAEQLEGLVQHAIAPFLAPGRGLLGHSLSDPGPYRVGLAGAWLDVSLLLLAGAGGLATAWQILRPAPQRPSAPGQGESSPTGWLAIEASFLLQGLALLSGSWLARRVWGSAWRADPVELGALLVMALSGVALATRRGNRRGLAMGLLFVAAAMALWTLFGAGRLPGPQTLHDFILRN